MIKIKKFYVVLKCPSGGSLPYCSKKFATLKGAKDHAAVWRNGGNRNAYGSTSGGGSCDYVVVESVAYIKTPVPPATWTKIE